MFLGDFSEKVNFEKHKQIAKKHAKLPSMLRIICFSESLPDKPQSLSCAYCWGGGILSPLKLPLPTNDTQVIEVSAGRTSKAAVTKNGRLFNWEVGPKWGILISNL